MVAAVRGYRCVVAVPHGTSADKLAVARALGAEIYECREDEDYVEAAARIARERGAYCPGQFENPENPRAHVETTADEIWRDLDGRVDALVAACGTGGTLAGVGRALRQRSATCRLYRVIPRAADGGESQLEGIAPEGPPPEFECPGLDGEVSVTDEEALAAARLLARTEGIFVGGSAGAALAGAFKLVDQIPRGARVVVILPDTGRNYATHRV
jgi:cysteine synthase